MQWSSEYYVTQNTDSFAQRSLTLEVGPTVFFGGCPLTGRGASGVVWMELDLVLLPWKLSAVLSLGSF